MTDTQDDIPAKRRWPWPVRVACVVVIVCALLGSVIGGGILYLTDRPIAAPDWLRDRIEQRIAQDAPDLDISSGAMLITVARGWRPSVQLQNVQIRKSDGAELVSLAELRASLAFRPLLEGLVQPKTVSLSGIFATLSRGRDGAFDLIASDGGGGTAGQAATLGALVAQVDDIFLRPELAALNALSVDAVTLRYEDARARRVWTVDGARLNITREGQVLRLSSDLAILGGGAEAATVSVNYDSTLGDPEARFGISVQDLPAADLADFNPAFGWLDGLRAPISGALRGGLAKNGALSPINATLQIGAGALQPTRETRPVPFEGARAYVTFDPALNELVFDELSIDSAWVKTTLEGRARLAGLETGQLRELVGQFRLSDLTVDQPELYDAPIAFEGAELDFRLFPDPFRLDLGQVRIVDQGKSLRLDGLLEAAPDGWHAAVNAHMEGITPERLMELWPEGAVDNTRNWLINNILSAQLSGVEFALRTLPKTKPDVFVSFDFEEADVLFMRTFPPITDAKGTGSILRNRFVLNVSEGAVVAPEGGRVDVSGSAFIIPDVTVKKGVPAEVRLKTDGTITATMALLNLDPLRIPARAGLPVTVAAGRAKAQIALDLPLQRKIENGDIAFRVDGTLRDVRSTGLVPGRAIAAPVLRVAATQDSIEIGGKGTFDTVPVDVAWSQKLGPSATGSSRLTGQVELSNASVTALNLGLPAGSVSGRGTGQLQVDLPKNGAPRFALTSNLRGVGLRIPPLGWSLGQASRGTLDVAGTLGSTPKVDRLSLDAPGLRASGSVSMRANGGLQQALFDRVRVGNWLDAPVTLVGRGAGAAPEVRVRGGTLDLRAAEFGSGGGGGGSGNAAGPMTLALDQLRITDTISLTNMRGDFSLRNGLQGDFTGKVNGRADVTGQVVPQGGRSAFRIKSQDAGAVFSAAGLLKQARGGAMSLTLSPVGTAGGFNGALNILNTRITEAPAIAALFNALSVVGLLEQMGGQGLHFGEVEAAFRLTPDRITLTKASAVGPSIGLSMDGIYDVKTSQMDMQGVFSPIYLINGVGSILTRKGEGLIGFNFNLKGPSDNPRVQVNPLSALTPSVFREIFRRPPPAPALEPGEAPGSAPSVQSAPVTPEKKPRRPVVELGATR